MSQNQITPKMVRSIAAEAEMLAAKLIRAEQDSGSTTLTAEFAHDYSLVKNVFRVFGVPGQNGDAPTDFVFTMRGWVEGDNTSFVSALVAINGQPLVMGSLKEGKDVFERIKRTLNDRLREMGYE